MKKKLLSTLLCVAMVTSLLTGCGSSAGTETTGSSSKSSEAGETTEEGETEEAEVEAEAVTTVGDPNGTHMEMWSFVELHNTYYGKMVEKWNAENPDRTIEVTFTTYPYSRSEERRVGKEC